MGYRSEIAIGVTPEIYATAPDDVKKAFDEVFGGPSINEADRILWHSDWMKWYSDDPLVQRIEGWLSELEAAEESYGLLRLGEDNNDEQEEGYPYEFGIREVHKLEIE